MIYHRVVVADERDTPSGEALVRDARPPRDAVAELMRANLRRALLGGEASASTLGRFTVLERIGGGAMGTVLAAYDPVLDRKVAIKVLRDRGEQAKARVVAEARALAQLSHPNVVAVHEVDEHEGEVYIAMEFVRGVDLRQWLSREPRGWAQVVPVLGEAARGLAAAHAAGVVHCDFKPANVLVGDDGVRVVDFGLAHRTQGPRAAPGGGGTLPYIAPERLDGGPPTAASDRFAFGVTLYEALWGRRPFGGDSREELRAAMERGAPPGESSISVPRWLDELVMALLAASPQARPGSMDAVVTELVRPRRTGRRAATAGLAAVTVLATGWAAYDRGTRRDPCDGGVQAVDAVWNEPRAVAMREALHRSGAPFAASTATRISTSLDAYRDRWVTAHRETCEATRVRGSQSDTTYDLRMRCLERGLDQVSALLDAVEVVDDGIPTKAVEAVASLPSAEQCDATRATAVRYAVPDDPQQRASVLEAWGQLDRGWASFRTGRYAAARTRSEQVLGRAESIAFGPLTAQARHLHGAVLGRVGGPQQAEQVLRQAMLDAAQVGDDALAAQIAIRLLRTMMFGHDPTRVHAVADFVRASIRRIDGDVHEVDGIVGEALRDAGDLPGAIEALTRALSTERRADRTAILQTTLGSAHLAAGHHQTALDLYGRALAGATEFYGADHPSVGFFLHRLGRGRREAGQLDAARQTLLEALELRQASLGPNDRAIASTLVDLALTETARGEPAVAVPHLLRALRIREAVYGDRHARVAEVLLPLGDALRQRGELGRAYASYRRALSLREALTPQHPALAELRERLFGGPPG